MKFLTRTFLVLGMFGLSALPLLAQTEVISVDDPIVEVSEAIEISNVLSEKKSDGSIDLTWNTNRLSAGAVTVVYPEASGAIPQKVIQQRLTSRNLDTSHSYNLRGLNTGSHSIFIEVVGTDMQYDSFSGIITIPEMVASKTYHNQYLGTGAGIMVFILLLLILYEVIRHRMEFNKAIRPVKKPVRTTKSKVVAKKTAAKKRKSTVKKTTSRKKVSTSKK